MNNLKKTWLGQTLKFLLKSLILAIVPVMIASLTLAPVVLADDDHGERRYRKDGDKKSWFRFKKVGVEPVTDKLYLEECGACHFAYQPGLLPSGSWEKIIASLEKHFGENAALDPKEQQTIRALLIKNAAEFSRAKRSYKIIRSLKGKTPDRISDVPYIRRKHRKLRKKVFKRESIRTLANCPACHTSASQGVYSERYITIPKK